MEAKGLAASLLKTMADDEEAEEEEVVLVMALVGLARTKLRVTCLRACILKD